MNSRPFYIRRLITVVVASVIVTVPLIVSAAPWLGPGDVRARHAVQKLSDRGHIEGTTTTWPIMWADLAENTSAVRDSTVASQRAYLGFERSEQAKNGFRAELEIEGATDPAFLRGFDSLPKEEGQLTATLQWQGESWAVGLSPSGVSDPMDSKEFRLDGSYIATTAGNWVLGVGAIERWWGPGWQSSMILSNNARPVPSIWVDRKASLPPETKWLSWIGPWKFTAFLGQLEKERVIPDARLIGMRFSFRPMDRLEVGLSRVIMYGGEGRPDGISTLWDALIGKDNITEGQTADDDASNQIATIDARYGFPVGDQSMGLYAQMMGEDEAGYLPSRKSWLFGIDGTTHLIGSDQQWFLEFTNTLAEDLLGDPRPNYAYNHFNYSTGYQYRGRALGSTFDADSEALSLGLLNFLPDGSNLTATLTFANLNKDGGDRVSQPNEKVFYSVPDGAQKVTIANLGYGSQLLGGWLDLNMQLADKNILLLGGEKDRVSLSASWKYRF
ncbi:capsule assembly Wzi family protein [Marinobacter sp. DY40_1A1]|uniref:capsule assembly Wzi family protein n=1 Tax=Marinobacter sp. DY40_1A1 TaxID=2583229 RepID=UPI00190699E4|nr:capsule assembly Wzi family protein [Marinobacter sp. DY40_1A1]MBK1885422.1 capsule assembly Wzi family protein [Marinobacter sp. DY40_1A1]